MSLSLCAKLPILLFLVVSCVNLAPVRQFSEPIVVITFDDANPSIYNYAFPTMRSFDSSWTATHFFPVVLVGSDVGISIAQIKEMEKAGWESGGHGFTHENLSSLPPDSVEKQVKGSFTFLKDNGLCHESFAYPWGNYNDTVMKIVNSYFKNIRTSHDFDYLGGINRKELGYYAVKSECTGNDIIARVENARQTGSPLVILGFHAILPDSAPSAPFYFCKKTAFIEFLTYLKKEELPVMTLKKAMDALCY